MTGSRLSWRALAGTLLILVSAGGCATAGRERVDPNAAAKSAPLHPLAMSPRQFLEAAQGIYVVVDLDTNRLRLMDGKDTLWTTLVGTGTGLRLQGPEGDWKFSTPRGVFQIQYKEEVPVWFLPDWYFVEKGLPIPPENSPQRKQLNQLGIAAVYIGQDLALHGTNHPELLGQRVSHGCIRLHNDYVLRLFHNVQVGTPVVIVGGEKYDTMPPAPSIDPAKLKPPAKRNDPLAGVPSASLLKRVDRALAGDSLPRDAVWVMSRLITRGLKNEPESLRGLLERAGTSASERVNREYATFLADAFARGSLRTVVALAHLEPKGRDRAADAIVRATMLLHPGAMVDERAPWPTRRVPASRLGPQGKAGWEALAASEAEYRGTAQSAARAAEEGDAQAAASTSPRRR